jgi:hypothetical protein
MRIIDLKSRLDGGVGPLELIPSMEEFPMEEGVSNEGFLLRLSGPTYGYHQGQLSLDSAARPTPGG